LLADGTAGEVRLTERARGVCGVVEFDAFVEASDLVILDPGSVYLVSSANIRGSAFNRILLHFVDEVELDALNWHLVYHGRVAIIIIELRIRFVAVVISNLDDAVVLKTTLKSSLDSLRLSGLSDVDSACEECWLE